MIKSYKTVDEEQKIQYIIKKIGYNILNKCKDKKTICLQLSGGRDTRSIFSILLNYNIKFSCIISDFSSTKDEDNRIAKNICEYYNIPFELHHYNKDDVYINGFISLCNQTKDYDIVFSGLTYTEYLNRYMFKARYCIKKFQDETLIYSHLPMIVYVLSNYHNLFFPLLDCDILSLLRYIKKKYLKNYYIQNKIINYYFSELMSFKFISI